MFMPIDNPIYIYFYLIITKYLVILTDCLELNDQKMHSSEIPDSFLSRQRAVYKISSGVGPKDGQYFYPKSC